MEVRATVVALLGQGASGKEQTGQGTERQRKSPALDELTFRGQRNTPEDVSSQQVAIPNARQSEGGHSRGRSLGHPYTGLLRGGRGGEASPTEWELRTRPEGSITPQGQAWLGVDTGAQEPAPRQHLEPDRLGSNPSGYTSPTARS